MRERPILFSAPMVRGILSGRKTMTRRQVKFSEKDMETFIHRIPRKEICCPYGKPGDRLWVRESFWEAGRWEPVYGEPGSCDIAGRRWKKFGARCFDEDLRIPLPGQEWRRIPSIHMPRAASRILLEITAIRVERLQAITEEDAIAEGIERAYPETEATWWRDYEAKPVNDPSHDPYYGLCASPDESFASLWRSINGIDSWEADPWVWVVEFRRISPE